jgi:integrase
LDPDKKKAFELWHELQAASCFKGKDATVGGLLAAFLGELEGTLSKDRFEALKYYARLFVKDYKTELITEIMPSTLTRWLDKKKPGKRPDEDEPILWKNSSKRHCAAFLKRAWKWGHNEGFIQINRLASFKLPESDIREEVITPDMHLKLVERCRSIEDSRPFALYLIASRCGARPQQIREVTAKHVSRCGTMWIFKQHKTSNKTNKPLVVYLHPCLQTITRILVAKHPSGPLFRNSRGIGWKSDTVSQRMKRLREKLNLPESTVVYLYRHTFATDAIVAGNSTAVVAELLGHSDTRSIAIRRVIP